MTIRIALVAAAILGMVSPTIAQDEHRFEITGAGGWTASDGVSGESILAGDGNVYNRIDPKDSFSVRLSGGYYVTSNVLVELLFDRQFSSLDLGGTNTRGLGNFNVDNVHGMVAYHFAELDAPIRPFLGGGLGWTNFGSLDITGPAGESRSIDGEARFSTRLEAGVKMAASPRLAFRAGVHFTPTYVKSDATGWWCDPYWGCYVTGDAQYSNQWEFSGGLSFRF